MREIFDAWQQFDRAFNALPQSAQGWVTITTCIGIVLLFIVGVATGLGAGIRDERKWFIANTLMLIMKTRDGALRIGGGVCLENKRCRFYAPNDDQRRIASQQERALQWVVPLIGESALNPALAPDKPYVEYEMVPLPPRQPEECAKTG